MIFYGKDLIDIDCSKRYRAKARYLLSDHRFRVYSASIPGRCSDGLQHWFDANLNDYGQINFRNPFFAITCIEELTAKQAAAVDRKLGIVEEC